MARPYTITHFFRRIPATLLARYFESSRVLTDSKKRGAKKAKPAVILAVGKSVGKNENGARSPVFP